MTDPAVAAVAVVRCLKTAPGRPRHQAADPPGTPAAARYSLTPLPVLSMAPPVPPRPGLPLFAPPPRPPAPPGLPSPPPPPPALGPPRAGHRPRLSTGGSERIGASSLPVPPGA